MTSTSTHSPARTPCERAYFAEMSTTPGFDRDRETERARGVVRSRRAYWAVLLTPAHLEAVLGVLVEHAKNREVVELAASLRAELQGHTSAGTLPHGLKHLAEAIDRVGDEHESSDAIVSLAAELDPRWHDDATRARATFLAARSRFVSSNLRLVAVYANRYGAGRLPLLDRIQEGNIGLIKAVDRFDPERGLRFSTYACWWIRHTIWRSLATHGRTVRIPSQVQALYRKLERARRRLSTELGREPEREEMAAAVGCTLEQFEKASAMTRHDVCQAAGTDQERDVLDGLADEDALAAIEDRIADGDRERLLAALGELPEREQDILLQRFGFSGASRVTLQELGQRHGMSRERIRQIQAGSLELLRRKLDPRKPFWARSQAPIAPRPAPASTPLP